MAQAQNYGRENNGQRFTPGGIDTVHPHDALPPGKYAYLQNVRAYKQDQIIGRSTSSDPVISGLPTPIHSMAIINDSTPVGPVGGYVRVIGAAGAMYVNAAQVASGYSTNPVAFCPFRPNTSVQPWMYIGDSSEAVILITQYLIDNTSVFFPCFGSTKVRSDGLIFKTGIKEPQTAPAISTENITTTGADQLNANTVPWTNISGANSTYNYGMVDAPPQITNPVIIAGGGPELVPGSTIVLTVVNDGAASVNGVPAAPPTQSGPTSANYPGSATGIFGTPSIIVGAFTDDSGNVIDPGGTLPLVFFIGAGTTVTVPATARQLQIGIDSSSNHADANWFGNNTGFFTITWTVTTNAVSSNLSTLSDLTAYYWGDSPTSGPVSAYIWKNPSDPGGSGPARTVDSAVGSTANNSFIFDATITGGIPQLPGTGIPANPMEWSVLNTDSTIAGTVPVFTPAIKGVDGNTAYQNFNFCLTGQLWIPEAGNYTFEITNHDDIIWGIGGEGVSVVSANATHNGGGISTSKSTLGQTITVAEGYPLLPRGKYPSGLGGDVTVSTVVVNFANSGVYPIEVDYDYWYHSGRILLVQASPQPGQPVAIIPPLPANVRSNVSYRYVYRSSATGAVSNPSPASTPQTTPVLADTVTPEYSPDPQVDKVDYYRIDEGIENYTYVATGPNTNPPTPITDELTDLEVSNNPQLEFDNYEPFPVIDLPHKGVVDVTGGVITWVSGDQFNPRWLPGTEILIGYPTALAYTFVSRPTSSISVTIPGVPDGTNLEYEIPEPVIAAQPLPYLWGPTDNAAYMFACGDPMNPGTLYFTKGNNPDSAPETNQIPVTSPSEPLQNGVITAGVGMVFSTERRWLIYPTFTTALADVEGVSGTPFNLVLASSERGLFIPTCVCTDGGNTTFFRAKDGIYACEFGGPDQYICNDIFNLFPREGFAPQPVTIAGNTIYPPDDTRWFFQKLRWGQTVLYYDYQDANGNWRTLVYDIIAKGWGVDVGQPNFTSHGWETGPNTDTVMVGCLDGTVRLLGNGNPEAADSIVIPVSVNAGDARAFKQLGDIFIKAIVAASNPILVSVYQNRYATLVPNISPNSLTGAGDLQPYILNPNDGEVRELIDVGITLTWPTTSADIIDLWQPSFLPLPEDTQDRPTDWDNAGVQGNKFIQGLLIEANTFGQPKAITVQRSDDGAFFTPNESPITLDRQQIIPLTFTPPFLAHSVKLVTTDGAPWRLWGTPQWVAKPFPESTIQWQTELNSLGQKGWFHIREMNIPLLSNSDVTLTLVFDQWPIITINIPSTGGVQIKNKYTIPPNKTKLVSFRLSSTEPFYVFQDDVEVKIKWWGSTGPYEIIKPYGGPSQTGAEL
jgi:hypothetical protein